MLAGKGDQYYLTESYESDRQKALKDRTKYSDTLLDEVDVLDDTTLGDGKTNEDSYEIKQFPFPVDGSVRGKKTVDLRKVDPRRGEMSDV